MPEDGQRALQGGLAVANELISATTPPSRPSLQDAHSAASECRSARAEYTRRNTRLTPTIVRDSASLRAASPIGLR